MLCINSYPKQYIAECRSLMESELAAYKNLVAAARAAGDDQAVASFEPLFFNSMVQVLDNFFVHRSRTLEKKDGNALNEVRMLSSSIVENRGVLAADRSIKYVPSKSVLKLEIGAEIRLTESQFVALYRAYFSEMEEKFMERAA